MDTDNGLEKYPCWAVIMHHKKKDSIHERDQGHQK